MTRKSQSADLGETAFDHDGPKLSYAPGDRVLHPTFGSGTVLFTTSRRGLRINFDAGQLRFVVASYVEPIEGTQA